MHCSHRWILWNPAQLDGAAWWRTSHETEVQRLFKRCRSVTGRNRFVKQLSVSIKWLLAFVAAVQNGYCSLLSVAYFSCEKVWRIRQENKESYYSSSWVTLAQLKCIKADLLRSFEHFDCRLPRRVSLALNRYGSHDGVKQWFSVLVLKSSCSAILRVLSTLSY